MATIVIFASSFSLASFLIIFKAVELRYGRRNPILGLIGKFDESATSILAVLKFRLFQLIQTVRYIALVQSKMFFRSLIDRLQDRIMSEYHLRESAIMGKRNIVNKGSVSFYLKKITEDKGGAEKGRIE